MLNFGLQKSYYVQFKIHRMNKSNAYLFQITEADVWQLSIKDTLYTIKMSDKYLQQ